MSDSPAVPAESSEGRMCVRSWFAQNPVAANLLMAAIVVTGGIVATQVRQEVYPSFALDIVKVSMEYRGASPEEIERSILLPIEAELRGMEIIHRLHAVAQEGRANLEAELVPGTDRNRGLQEVTAAIQRISLFPDEAELPDISLETGRRREVVRLAVHGELDERSLVDFARQVEEGLLAEPGISLVEFTGLRRPEIRIEVPEARLRSLGLTLDDVARAIDDAALDVPAGTIKTRAGDILLKTRERRDYAREFAQIPIISTSDGTKVALSEIATIHDGFEESEREAYLDGHRAVRIGVFSTETQTPLDVARAVRNFVERERARLPDTVGLTLTWDRSKEYEERLVLLLENGGLGLLLVLLALGLVLELRVAFWTAVGIPVSIIGAISLLPAMDASINMISLFGFIVTLGIVVDDAIVVGEEIFHQTSRGVPRLEAAIRGVRRMTVPVVFAVSTNIIAFLPLLFVPGETGLFFRALPAVVIAVFTISLVECLFVLPAHLAHMRPPGARSWWTRLVDRQNSLREKIDIIIDRFYSPVIRWVLRRRYLTVSAFAAALAVVSAYVFGGHIDFTFRPSIQTDFVQAEIELPTGTPLARVREVAFEIEEAGRRALAATGEKDIVVGIFTTVAEDASNEAEVSVILVPQSERKISSEAFANLWRDHVGEIPDLESLFYDYLFGPGGSAEINVQLAHPDVETLRHAATELADAVARFPGVEDIRKGFGRAMPQLEFEITPEGRSLGITARELGAQIRNSFYGAEALRQPRDRDELRVMVRLPDDDRRTLYSLENLLLRVPDGGEIPLRQAAVITRTEAPVRIERVDGGRVLNVTANVIPGVTNGNRVLSALERDDLPRIIAKHPGLRYSFEGEQREQREALDNLSWGMVAALFAIYAIMASILRSYAQAIVVFLTVPWSLAGAVVGHVIMGFDLSIFSIFGMIALCGMVVNGAIVLAMTRSELLAGGESPAAAIRLAAERRFRPIVLTAVTTFLGLGPMIFETSTQALFLVPMAIALGLGTLASAVVTLTFIPAVVAILDDLAGRSGSRPPAAPFA